MTVTYERQRLDPDVFGAYHRQFLIFNTKLITFDVGPLASQGQIIESADGAIWSNLFTIDPAVVGIQNQSTLDGQSLAIFQDNLFVSQNIGAVITDSRVLEWDGSTITQHLNAISQTNQMTYSLLVWNSRLWLISDITPFIPNCRRVVYYYDGSAWTAIVDYDGATFLDYNKASNVKDLARSRRSQLFVFSSQLYLFATRYDTVSAKWGWQIWRFDANDFDNFALIYEQYDDYALSGVLLYKGEVVVTANKIAAGPNPSVEARIYASINLLAWTTLGTYPTLGMVYWAEGINNKMFLNTHDRGVTNNTRIRFFDPWLGDPELDGDITTNPSAQNAGGLFVFLDELYVGKWLEIYKRVSDEDPLIIPPIIESPPLVITEWPFMDKNLAPIDIVTPLRFFDGRLLAVPSTSRSVDDRTGLPSVGDLTVTIANHDNEVSKWLHDFPIWKGNVVIAWIVRPAASLSARLAYFKYVIVDHWRDGPNVIVLLRDVLRKYFERSVPEDICT